METEKHKIISTLLITHKDKDGKVKQVWQENDLSRMYRKQFGIEPPRKEPFGEYVDQLVVREEEGF